MKQFRKRMLASGLAVTVIMGTTAPTIKVFANEQTSTPRFNDVSESHWAKSQIDAFITEGVISGYPDGSFKPNNKITRAEFVKIVNKAFGFTSAGEITFTDVKEDDWYATDIKIAVEKGYINGFEDGTFRPNEEITREQMAKILGTILNITGDGQTNFIDDSSIAPWAKKYVDGLVEKGVIQGYPDGTFKPKGNATRAEGVKLTSDSKTHNNSQNNNNNNDSTQKPEEQKPSTEQGTGTGGFFPNFGGSTGGSSNQEEQSVPTININNMNKEQVSNAIIQAFKTSSVVVLKGDASVGQLNLDGEKTLKIEGNITFENNATLSNNACIDVSEGSKITINGELSLENGGVLNINSSETATYSKSNDGRVNGKGNIKVGKGSIYVNDLADIQLSIIGVNKDTKLKISQLWVVHPTRKDTALTINNYNTTLDFEFGATHQELGKVHTMTVNGGKEASLTFNDAWRNVVVKATEGAKLELNAPSNWNYAVALLYKQGTTYGYEEAYKGKYTGNKDGSWTKETQESIPQNPVITEVTTNGTINDLQQIYTETIKIINANGDITLIGTNEIKNDQTLNMLNNTLVVDGNLKVSGTINANNIIGKTTSSTIQITTNATISSTNGLNGEGIYKWNNDTNSWVKQQTESTITNKTITQELLNKAFQSSNTVRITNNAVLSENVLIQKGQKLIVDANLTTQNNNITVNGTIELGQNGVVDAKNNNQSLFNSLVSKLTKTNNSTIIDGNGSVSVGAGEFYVEDLGNIKATITNVTNESTLIIGEKNNAVIKPNGAGAILVHDNSHLTFNFGENLAGNVTHIMTVTGQITFRDAYRLVLTKATEGAIVNLQNNRGNNITEMAILYDLNKGYKVANDKEVYVGKSDGTWKLKSEVLSNVNVLTSTTTETITTSGIIESNEIKVTTSQAITDNTTTISTIFNGENVSEFNLNNLNGNLKIQFKLADKKSLVKLVINGYEIKLPQGLEINSKTLVTIELTKEQLKTLGLDETKEANELKIQIQEK